MDSVLVLGLKALFLSRSSSPVLTKPDTSSSVNGVPCLASLAVVGHQRDVLQMPRIQVISKNNNFGGSRPAQN